MKNELPLYSCIISKLFKRHDVLSINKELLY